MLKMMVFSFVLFLLSLMFMFFGFFLMMENKFYVFEWMIYGFNSMKMNFILMINFKLMMFVFLVMLISSVIMFYSASYMDLSDKFYVNRFYYLMMLFLMSMIFLILSPNMLTLLLGWDGLGLISYCLIIFYQKKLAFNSGMLTIILNRLGDSSLLMIISFMTIFGSWNLILYEFNMLILLMFFLMVFTKSAQLMFMIWLPAAMMAPTPVSSLVHSSTLVTAGIYLLINYESLIELKYKMYILMISSMTMLISGIMANFEMDFKKIIALSTLSQLGFMMSIYSLGMVNLTFLHLFIHAFFKSMMFMCAGSFIHYMMGIQNFRFYLGAYYLYPLKGLLLLLSLLMLSGFPFLVGYYSKDLIIEHYFLNVMSIFSVMNLILGTIFTVSYSTRILMLMFKSNYKLILFYMGDDVFMTKSIVFIKLIMIYMSKLVHDFFFFELDMNLIKVYKYFVFKMILLGILLSYIFNNININNESLIFMKSFFLMEYLYKFILNHSMGKFISYELFLEKGLMEKLTGKMMCFVNEVMKFKGWTVVIMTYLLIMYIYMFLVMLFI
uniref:NADH:ubiquinone reductase (H(+)-translocating) n=1 Tax=Bombus kashmirensis TaxID=395536 RepID=A0A482JMT0_9HYME|nr:NADH dehydrogenase subunit 5 [Bombus kashmirensis]